MNPIALIVSFALSLFVTEAFGLTAPVVSVTEETNTTITLSWKAPLEAVDGYVVQEKMTRTVYVDVIDLAPTSKSYTVMGLTPNSSHTYRVVAYKALSLPAPSSDVIGKTTHTWSGALLTCLQASGTVSTPPTRAELLTISSFECRGKGLTSAAPVGDLVNLTDLDLGSNSLTTTAGWLGKLKKLGRLLLNENQLAGSIPVEIGNLTSLYILGLRNNQLTGPIPSAIYNLSNLQNLTLSGNQLTDPLSTEIAKLNKLVILSLGDNLLTGSIPLEIYGLTSLMTLNLSFNQLTGQIAPEIGNLTSLKSLDLGWNQLHGPIPAELSKLTSLTYLFLTANNLSGAIPGELGKLGELKQLRIDDNELTGPIPQEMGNLTALWMLYLSSNQLECAIPQELGNLTQLSILKLEDNQLCGEVPTSFLNLENLFLHGLDLSNNFLFTEDPDLKAFLDSLMGDWESSQGVCERTCSDFSWGMFLPAISRGKQQQRQ